MTATMHVLRLPVWRQLALKLLRVKVTYGDTSQRLMSGGPLLVTCRHGSLLDGLIIAFASPRPMVFPVTTKHSVRNRFTRYGLRVLEALGLGRAVAMDTDHPASVRQLLRALRGGEVVMLFPSGRITKPDESVPDLPGTEWLCEHARVDVSEVDLRGAERSRLFAPSGDRLWPKIALVF